MSDYREPHTSVHEAAAPQPAWDETQLQLVVDAMSAAVTQCSRDMRYLWVSQAYADWLGLKASEVVGRRIEDVIGAEGFAAIYPRIERVLAGERVEYEETLRYRGIGDRSIHAVYSPTYNGDGQPSGWVAVVRDVTKEQQDREALRAWGHASRRLAAIVESSDDAIISKDLNGIITSWNKAAERIFGYAAAEVIGRSIRIIIPHDRQTEEDDVLAHIRRGESVDHFETIRQRKDGRMVAISLTISPIRDAAGTIVGASKIGRDISRQQQITRRMSFLVEAGTVLATTLDYESTLTRVANLAVPAIADWCAVDIVRGGDIKRLAVAHVDPAKVAMAELIRERYEDPKSPYSVARVIRTATPVMLPEITDEMIVAAARGDEERIRLVRSLGVTSFICVPLVTHDETIGALTLVTGSSRPLYTDEDLQLALDLASRAAIAVENARAYDHVTRANRLKDEFLATLSHELRTPLNAILGYSRMMRSGLTSGEKQAKAIATVERNATSLTQIVEDVLDVSRIISGKLRLDVQPVELPRVVENAVDSMLPAASAKGVGINIIADPRAAPALGDPERLQQVVWNLVSNAVKFTPRGGSVQVRVQRADSHCEIVVSDTGIGMSEEFLKHVFERFRQADAGMNRAHGGLGLGLAITRHLVEMHGGTIHAASSGPGTGATFRVSLPVMIVHPAPRMEKRPALPQDATSEPQIALPNLHGVRILAVDDDVDALSLLREILEAAGGEVTTVDSAAAALDVIDTLVPDVLIADVGMPRMDGFELIAQIRKRARPAVRGIPAAALTAYARSDDRTRALRSGFQMHMAKPIDPGELMAAVAALARRNTNY